MVGQGFEVAILPGRGRGVVAARPIRPGQLILAQDPYAWVLADDQVGGAAAPQGGRARPPPRPGRGAKACTAPRSRPAPAAPRAPAAPPPRTWKLQLPLPPKGRGPLRPLRRALRPAAALRRVPRRALLRARPPARRVGRRPQDGVRRARGGRGRGPRAAGDGAAAGARAVARRAVRGGGGAEVGAWRGGQGACGGARKGLAAPRLTRSFHLPPSPGPVSTRSKVSGSTRQVPEPPGPAARPRPAAATRRAPPLPPAAVAAAAAARLLTSWGCSTTGAIWMARARWRTPRWPR
jgi:hypothetical protein